MNTRDLPARAMDTAFRVKIGAGLLLMLLAVWSLASGAPGHPVYAVALIILAFGSGCHVAAAYGGRPVLRDAYLFLTGLAAGLMAFRVFF
jgi:hypothetical protein